MTAADLGLSNTASPVSTQPAFTGYPSMNATYPGIMAPSQPISVAPNIDYGPPLGTEISIAQGGTGGTTGIHPGIVEAMAEPMFDGVGGLVDINTSIDMDDPSGFW